MRVLGCEPRYLLKAFGDPFLVADLVERSEPLVEQLPCALDVVLLEGDAAEVQRVGCDAITVVQCSIERKALLEERTGLREIPRFGGDDPEAAGGGGHAGGVVEPPAKLQALCEEIASVGRFPAVPGDDPEAVKRLRDAGVVADRAPRLEAVGEQRCR